MKKTHILFILIILLEIFSVIIIYFFLTDLCPSNYTCNKYSFLNPFGYNSICPDYTNLLVSQMCYPRPHQLFYTVSDLLILTIVIYIIYLTYPLIKKPNKRR